MRVWTAIGIIFTFIGFIILVLGISQIVLVYNTYNQLGGMGQYLGSVMGTVVWAAFGPYFVSALAFFVIGGVGFIAGRGSKADVTVSVMNETKMPASNFSYETKHPCTFQSKSTISCGNCGTINDIDAVYCKKCALKFRQD